MNMSSLLKSGVVLGAREDSRLREGNGAVSASLSWLAGVAQAGGGQGQPIRSLSTFIPFGR